MRYVRKQPFYLTVTASMQQFYRNIVIGNLKGCEQLILRRMMNLWFRHCHKGAPLAPGYQEIADWSGYSVRRIKTIMAKLIDKGFLVLAYGGVGRGNKRHFAVDLTAIHETLAPGLIEPKPASVKGEISAGAYNKELLIGRAYRWTAGLVGRCSNFQRRFVLAIQADKRATWRKYVETTRITDTLIASLGWATGHQEAEA